MKQIDVSLTEDELRTLVASAAGYVFRTLSDGSAVDPVDMRGRMKRVIELADKLPDARF